MNKKISFPIAIIIIVVACAVLTGLIAWQYGLIPEIGPSGSSPGPSEKEVTIATDKTEYEQGEIVKTTVRNNLDKSICFESCNPYYLEKKNGKWESIGIIMCFVNFIKECIEYSAVKVFEYEVTKTDIGKGVYRIVIPIYTGCQNEEFPCGEEKTIYSNEFTIERESKGICGPKGMGSNYDVLHCDKSCVADNDCKFTCGCGVINNNEICYDEGIIYDCVDRDVRCENSVCVAGEELF